MILAVAIDTPLRRVFDYRAPADWAGQVRPGHRVRVPFGRRRIVGVVVECRQHSEVAEDKLRSAQGLIDEQPTFDPGLLDLLRWSADYYRHPLGEVIAAALPGPLRQGAPAIAETTLWRLTAAGRDQALADLPARAKQMRAAVQALLDAPELAPDVLDAAGLSRETLRKLRDRGYAEQFTRTQIAAAVAAAARRDGPALNDAQAAAVERIRASLGTFVTWLLHGVTGSGKTEVYLNAIATVLERGEQALVLVPEIALTPQLIARFRERFDTALAILHSGLSDGERLSAWRDARSGAARIVIGTRSAIFVPLARPGLIVVDEEHDSSFKQQEGFRYSARDLAIVRAQRLRIPVVLGSATPSLESLNRARQQPGSLLTLPHRAADARPPTLALIDLRRHAAAQGIATPALMAMQRHLDAGRQVLLFLNRRGYAPVLFCPACGWSAHCKRCDANLTVHRNSTALLCHHCGSQQSAVVECPSCFAEVKPVGQGTERIEETLERMFPQVPLARIDRDSMRRKGELEETLAKVDRNEIRLLVGTQMLTKGHHFPNVTLVVVLNADQGLFSTDFRASERLAQTIVQVAGRAGRAAQPGEVLIQTEYPEHPLLNLLLKGGYDAFAAGALQEREQAGWPPFSRIALLRAEATHSAEPRNFLQAALAAAREHGIRGVKFLGPAPAPMERRAGRHRAQLLLQAATHQPLQRLLSRWIPQLEGLPEARRVRWSIDVDPGELF
ncbi:MAG TPA: primosomal protein N' [Povalibacter sp.]|uniref:primosomal protein N' n=1 Tax=Povalibacter sp. TaxID=1962978 RepID=UPI002B522F76|nr:primosomal protein N' [Povalibacter sp.]HMN44793.1 primosomal protein N' [Povalibacter sp.]